MPENIEAFKIFNIVRNQHIMGFGGPVDLNFTSVKFVMDLFRVQDRKVVFEKVYKIYQLLLIKINEEQESKQPLSKSDKYVADLYSEAEKNIPKRQG